MCCASHIVYESRGIDITARFYPWFMLGDKGTMQVGRCPGIIAGAFVVAALLTAVTASPARAAEVPEPVGFFEPILEGPSPECARADRKLEEKLRPVLDNTIAINLSLGDIDKVRRNARALCEQGLAYRGMMLYFRLSDAVSNAVAIATAERRAAAYREPPKPAPSPSPETITETAPVAAPATSTAMLELK
jgi:hypothetical protein